MYYCNDCHETFLDTGTDIIVHSEVDTRRNEIVGVCPHCGSYDFDEAEHCQLCGDVIPHETYSDNDGLCNECLHEWEHEFYVFVQQEMKAHHCSQYDAVNWIGRALDNAQEKI